ncbi:MAG: arginine deiminase-related protein [Thermoguttaceae bacterium]
MSRVATQKMVEGTPDAVGASAGNGAADALARSRTADAAVMVRPRDFGFNPETAIDNEFLASSGSSSSEQIAHRANVEFQTMLDRLRAEEIEILVLEPNPTDLTRVPDAVFPNNWFSTEHDGTLLVYPMMAPNRRAERRIDDLVQLLRDAGRLVREVVLVAPLDENERFLEGTGALVIDHATRTVYASRSQRCHPEQFQHFIRSRGYREGILFNTAGSSGHPIYHTNVMMNLGQEYAVVCPEAIRDPADRDRVMQSLRRSFDVIDISMPQMEKHFCGNVLELRNRRNEPRIILSARAEQGFTPEQRRRLSAHGKLVSIDLDTIEQIGGGSARCMLAEVFCPRAC